MTPHLEGIYSREIQGRRVEFAPDYWQVVFRLNFPAPPVKCARNPFLKRTRARKLRRVYESILNTLLSDVEDITRFPAYFSDPLSKRRAGDGVPFTDPWEVVVASYSLGKEKADQAAALALVLGLQNAPVSIYAEVKRRDN